jgi:hypothetical protein
MGKYNVNGAYYHCVQHQNNKNALNMDAKQTLYEVSYDGAITRLTFVEKSESHLWFKEETMDKRGYDDEGNLVLIPIDPTPQSGTLGISMLNLKKDIEEKRFAFDLEEAKKISAERQNEHYPKGRVWAVVRYWDDYPDKVMNSNLTYKEAVEMHKTYKVESGSLYSYNIRRNGQY